MIDETEAVRRQMVSEQDSQTREQLQEHYSEVLSTDELAAKYKCLSFMAPFVCVQRKEDGKTGSMQFQHSPRFYFGFEEDASC